MMSDEPPVKPLGYRGYITARPILGEHVPQHVQNLVIRDFTRRQGIEFRLSATEYASPGCYQMLENVLDELPWLEGIVVYSLFMLPQRRERRAALWSRILGGGKRLFAALESQSVASYNDVDRVEDLWMVRRALPLCPVRL